MFKIIEAPALYQSRLGFLPKPERLVPQFSNIRIMA
jgi:hypothetical protein